MSVLAENLITSVIWECYTKVIGEQHGSVLDLDQRTSESLLIFAKHADPGATTFNISEHKRQRLKFRAKKVP